MQKKMKLCHHEQAKKQSSTSSHSPGRVSGWKEQRVAPLAAPLSPATAWSSSGMRGDGAAPLCFVRVWLCCLAWLCHKSYK